MNACRKATTASSVPAIGVHKPAISSIPTPTMSTSGIAVPKAGKPSNGVKPLEINTIPGANRSRRRPIPGAPRANVEKSRRTDA